MKHSESTPKVVRFKRDESSTTKNTHKKSQTSTSIPTSSTETNEKESLVKSKSGSHTINMEMDVSDVSNSQLSNEENLYTLNNGKKKKKKKRMKGNKQRSEPNLTHHRKSPHEAFQRTASTPDCLSMIEGEKVFMFEDKFMSKEEQEELMETARERRSIYNRSKTFTGINSKIKALGLKREEEIMTAPRSSSYVCTPDMDVLDERISRKSLRFSIGYADTVGRRKGMEDTMVVVGQVGYEEQVDLFAIFDGHGGDSVSQYAYEYFPYYMEKKIRKNRSNPGVAISDALRDLQDSIKKKNLEGGSTSLIALFVEDICYIANVGDSRAVMCQDGVAVRVTTDHTPENHIEKNRIESIGGKIKSDVTKHGKIVYRINDVISVSRSIGDIQLSDYISSEPDLFEISLKEHNYLILACDGLWDEVSDEEAISICNQYINEDENSIEEAAMRLRDVAWNRGSTDNISVMIIRLVNKKPKNSLNHSKCIIN